MINHYMEACGLIVLLGWDIFDFADTIRDDTEVADATLVEVWIYINEPQQSQEPDALFKRILGARSIVRKELVRRGMKRIFDAT